MNEINVNSNIKNQNLGKQFKAKKKLPVKDNFKKNLENITLKQKESINKNKNNPMKKQTEIRQDLVSKYRTGLKKGTYTVKAEEIAAKIIQKIRDQKSDFSL
tara:strand:- start:928 stop:1233 length:306 start_codon:yes stop_codon:yes gene_type:complete